MRAGLSSTANQSIEKRNATHCEANHGPERHRNRERRGDARERDAEIKGERTGARLLDDCKPDGLRVRQEARADNVRAGKPLRKQQRDRGGPHHEIHSLGPAL